MALHRAGKRLAGRCSLPPGLLRLGLPSTALEDVARAAASGGPQEALAWLVQRQHLQDDARQHRAAEHLAACWRAVRAQAEALPPWERAMAAWEVDCTLLRAARAERQRRRAEEWEARKVAAEQRGEKVEEAAEELEEEPLILLAAPRKPALAAAGCYLWGEVGRGKTLLMDLFALSLQQEEQQGIVVRRAHFHDYMHGVHRRLAQLRHEGSRAGLSTVARETAAGSPAVFCFDEFQITNIADATLMTPLLSELFTEEAAVVATSNRPPIDLFKDGLNRDGYLPAFVDALERRLHVHHLDAPLDYRAVRRRRHDAAGAVRGAPLRDDYHVQPASGERAAAALTEAFAEAAAGVAPAPQRLPVAWGRHLACPGVAGGVARFSFDELCGQPLSAEDYSALVTRAQVHTFVLSDVPRFTLKQHNEARRFTNLVDTLYEHQCRLVCSAGAPIDELLAGLDRLCTAEAPAEPPEKTRGRATRKFHKHGDVSFEVSGRSPCRPDTFATAEADAEAGTSVWRLGGSGADSTESGGDGVEGVMAAAVDSLRESGFAARRCVSRLREMSTSEYRAGHDARWLRAT